MDGLSLQSGNESNLGRTAVDHNGDRCGQMPDNTRVQADLAGSKIPSKSTDSAASLLATDSLQEITEIARKLAAHGGGSPSLDLAFDLVLHEIAEQARAASGATGAAIALTRDSQMVCRATTGDNAPDLGVSVEAASGLTGTCLKTGNVQWCMDTESDPGVDPETCRRLGVRSMLLIPLVDMDEAFGVMELFSSSPNAFREQEMATLLRLADRVAQNRRAMLQSLNPPPKPSGVQVSIPDQLKPRGRDQEPIASENFSQPDSSIIKTNELWTAVLFLLVIVTAISLGIVVGWSNGRKASTTPRGPAQPNAAATGGVQLPTKLHTQDSATDSTGSVDPSSDTHKEAKSVAAPAGGLVVSENGKVIYRFPEEPTKSPKRLVSKPGPRELIHRVEPAYPPKARAQHIEGVVILDLEIGQDGSIANAAVVSGDPLLASAAVQAVRQWQYQPDPGSASRTRVTLQFSLPVN